MKDESWSTGDVPVRFLIGALVVGVVVGAIAPVSEYERRNAVPARAELTRRARRAIQDFLDHARSVLQETLATARESTTKHGQQLATEVRQEFGEAPESSSERQPDVPAP